MRFAPKNVPIEESVGALAELRREGKIRLIGLSNVSVEELRRAQAVTPVASVQNQYSPDNRESEDVLDAAEGQGIAFLPWGPLGAGMPAAQALRWLLERSPVILPIPGMSSLDHLEENMA
jgi:aryl-alcohol dehydrogenase-like predicted oxidoreductase